MKVYKYVCHESIKFDYSISKKSVAFLDTLVYIDDKNLLQTTLYRKKTNRQNFLHKQSEHPHSLKKSIPYSQTLRIKRICSTKSDFEKQCYDLKEKFIQRGYSATEVQEQINKASRIGREELLLESSCQRKHDRIPLVLPYNRTTPKISNIINKYWSLLKINQNLAKSFELKPILSFKRSKNLKNLIGGNTLVNGN